MKKVNVHEAKTHLSQLLIDVCCGEEVVIARAGKPVARLVPYTTGIGQRVPGQDEGKVFIAPDFDAALPDSVHSDFEA